jgi:membrane protease YdiL (CAAX protease family)
VSETFPPRPDLTSVDESRGERPSATWHWWEVAAFTILGFVLGSMVAAVLFAAFHEGPGLPSGGFRFVGLIVAAAVNVAVLLLWLRTAHPGWSQVVGWPRKGERLREAAVGVGFGVLFQIGAEIFSGILILLIHATSGTEVHVPQQVESGLQGWAAVALATYAVIAAPITEELVFRGLLFHSVADRRGFWPGAIASAIPFGLIHIVPDATGLGLTVLVVTMMGNGLAWAGIHRWRRNLLVNIVIHGTFNLIGVAFILGVVR